MRRILASLTVLALLTPPPVTAQEPDTSCAAVLPAPGPAPQFALGDTHRIARGEGVRVAVIDTGVADHPQLAPVDPVADLVAPATPDPLLDCDGHGTVVAGVIREVAPGATILSVRQSSAHYRQPDADSAGTLASLADAIHAALDAGAQVLNISVVSCVPADQAALLDAAVLDHALLRAEEQGVVVVSASGNNGGACLPGAVVYPAHSPTVLPVAARHADDPHSLAEYSLPADNVLSAPGRVTTGVSPSGDGWAAGMVTAQGQEVAFEGTSFAAPVVTGVAALLRQRHPGDSAAQLRERIRQAAEPSHGAVDPHTALTHLPGAYITDPRQVAAAAPTPEDPAAGQRAITLLATLAALVLGGTLLGRVSAPGRSPRRTG